MQEALETFRWHQSATVDKETYHALHDEHRLIADVVCFPGCHINHLTPRTLDIDRVRWQRRPGTTGGKLPWNDWRNATTWRKATQLLLLAINIYT